MRIIPLLLLFSICFGSYGAAEKVGSGRRDPIAEIMVGKRDSLDGTSAVDLTPVSSTVLDQASNMSISKGIFLPTVVPPSHAKSCNDQPQTCSVVKSDPEEHLKFGISFINYNKSLITSAPLKDCQCIEDEVRNELTKTSTDFETAKNLERQKVNDKILKSYGRKFVRQFADNLLNVTFLLNQSKGMFADQSKAVSYQCNDESRFSEKVTSLCKQRKIDDPEFIKGRQNLFIKTMSGEGNTIKDRLTGLTLDVLGAEKVSDFDNRKSGDTNPSNKGMSRVDYDGARMDLVKNDPQALFMRSFIDGLLKNPAYNRKIDESLSKGKTPAEALVNLVKENKDSLGEEAKKYLHDDKSIEVSFKFMMLIHPGIDMALMDNKAFANLRKVVKPNSNTTFFDAINSTTDVLEPIIADRCKVLIDEFAEAVCTKDDELITKVDPDELEQLMHEPENENDPPKPESDKPEMHELLICESRIQRGKLALTKVLSSFSSLRRGASGRESDYVANTGNVRAGGMRAGGGDNSLYSRWSRLAANDGRFRDRLGNMVDRNNVTRTGFDGPGIVANKVHAEEVMNGSSMKLGNSSMSKEEAKRYLDDNKKWEDKRLADSGANSSVQKSSTQVASNDAETQGPSQPQSFVAPQTNASAASNYSNVASNANSKQAEQAREQLRQYMADKNNSAEATKAVNALDDNSAEELNKLRNERQSLLEQQLKDGEARLKDLRSQLSDAASKVQSPVPDRNIASVDDEQESDDIANSSNSSNSSSGRNPRTIDQRQAIGGGSIGGGQVSSNAGAASTGGSKSGSVVSSNKVAKEASDTEAQVANSPNAQSDVTGSVIITAADVKASGTLPAKELNQEVQKFLASSDLSSASIQDIKSKGIKIRFNVMENNKLVQKEVIVKYDGLDQETRNQIDLKLARNNVRNQISKLTVLKLLISSSTNR